MSVVLSISQLFFISLTSVFFLVDPIAAIPTFLVMTSQADQEQRRHMAKRAAFTCFIVLTAFGLCGTWIFQMFGITLPAFKIAGGIILLLIGLEMLQARRSNTKETPGETEEGAEKEDVGIIPLGIPMLAGPGSISAVMVLVSQSQSWLRAIPIFASIAITSAAAFHSRGRRPSSAVSWRDRDTHSHALDGSSADGYRHSIHAERIGGRRSDPREIAPKMQFQCVTRVAIYCRNCGGMIGCLRASLFWFSQRPLRLRP